MQTIPRLRLVLSACAALSPLLAAVPCAWSSSPYSIALEWTAPGDDANVGRAYRYDLRYSTTAVGADTVGWWNAAGTATSLPPPSPSGQADSATVRSLVPETTYYFVLRTFDEWGNVSGFSNVAAATTDAEIPPPTPGCNAPASAPTPFQAREDSSVVLLSWGASFDPLARALRVWRGAGASGPLGLLTTVYDPSVTEYRDASVRPGKTYRYRATWSDSCGDGPATAPTVVSIPNSATGPPTLNEVTLHAYPNPSRDAVRFVIHVEGSSEQLVHIRLYDLTGHVVADIAEGAFPSGDTVVSWPRLTLQGDRVAAGYYESIGTVGMSAVRERLILLP